MPATLLRVQEYLAASSWEFTEVVVVDDGSRDGTAAVAEAAGVRVLRNPGNRGKGYSVRHGMLEAKGEWALFSDADLSSPIEEVERLWGAAACLKSRRFPSNGDDLNIPPVCPRRRDDNAAA